MNKCCPKIEQKGTSAGYVCHVSSVWHAVTWSDRKITRMDKITISIIIWNAMHFSHLSRASYTHISVGDMKGDPNRD